MALTIVSQPPAIAPVKQPIRLVLETDNYSINNGVRAYVQLDVAGMSDLSYFFLKVLGISYKFTATNTPDPTNGFHFFANPDPVEICNELVTMFNTLPFFADNYTVTSNGSSWVRLTAKVISPAWTIIFEPGTSAFFGSGLDGEDVEYQPNFKVELLLTQGNVRLKKEARVDGEDQATFILEELLEALVPSYYPDLTGEYLFEDTGLLMAYSLGWNESYGAVPVSMRRTTASYKAMPGLFEKAAYPGSSLAAYITNTTARKFLTHMPRVVELKPLQKMVLYIYQDGSKSPLNVVGKFRKRNNDNHLLPMSSLVENADYIETLAEGIVALIFDLSWWLNEIAGSIDDVVELQLGISFGSSSPHYSELITVMVDHSEPSESEVGVLFKSQAGVMELVYFEGDQELGVKTTRSLGELLLPADYTKATGEIQTVEVSRQRELKLHSGYKSRDYIVWLQELSGSDEVYLIDGQFNRLRVNITGSGNDLAETNQELFSMTLNVQEAFIDRT